MEASVGILDCEIRGGTHHSTSPHTRITGTLLSADEPAGAKTVIGSGAHHEKAVWSSEPILEVYAHPTPKVGNISKIIA
eukprot:4234691-Amphidinium_carterae.1